MLPLFAALPLLLAQPAAAAARSAPGSTPQQVGQSAGSRDARELLRELERGLRSPWPDKRRRSLKKLAALDSPAAWELVFGALEDPDPSVADEAQVRLGQVGAERVRDRLLIRQGLEDRDPWVRLRVAEALGRVPCGLKSEKLLRQLRGTDAAFGRTLLWSFERQADAQLLSGSREKLVHKLESLCASPSRGLRPAALVTLAALDPVRARALAFESCTSSAADLRCAGLEVARAFEPATARGLVQTMLDDEAPRVRVAAIRSSLAVADRRTARALVARLELEPRLRVRWHLVDALQSISGFAYRLDPRPWKLWAEGLPADWKPVGESEGSEGTAEADLTRAFQGLPVYSDRVSFLVDFSGSLWEEREDGRTRKASADRMLAAALSSLAAGAKFNVVPYTDRPLPWREQLEVTRPSSLRSAQRYFEDCRARGKGNFFDAVLYALADPEVDTIVVLTDGAPTGGRRWNLELMVQLLLQENRFRHVVFDVVLVDTSPRLQKHWNELARLTGGRAIAIE